MSIERWPQRIDRYVVCDEFASGGTASVHFGRLVGPAGFGRIVAIKRLRDGFLEDQSFVRMLVDEAKLAARINHQNVVQTLDVLMSDQDTYVVMDYVRGVPLSLLAKRSRGRSQRIDPAIASTIMSQVLHGLHAAHEATDEQGKPLGIVHRDVSPQNVLVGVDGAARVLDFGIAKAVGMTQVTREGYVKGKLAYIAPEHLLGRAIDRRADIFAAGVVLWELLTGERLFASSSDVETIAKLTNRERVPPSAIVPDVAPFDDLILSCLDPDPAKRPPTARAMAAALQDCGPMVPSSEIGEWVNSLAGDVLEVHRQHLSEIEAYDLAELIALPDQQVGAAGAAPESDDEYEPAPPIEGEEEGDASEVLADDAPSESEATAGAPRQEPSEAVDEEAEDEPEEEPSSEPEESRARFGRLLISCGLVAIGITAFGWRDKLSEYLFGSDTDAEAKSAAPEPMDSAAPQAASSAATPIRPAAAAPEPTGIAPASPAAPPPAPPSLVEDRAEPRESAASDMAGDARNRPVPSRPRAERTRPATPADRGVIVRTPPFRPTSKGEDCSPPYRVDSDGVKIYKVECL